MREDEGGCHPPWDQNNQNISLLLKRLFTQKWKFSHYLLTPFRWKAGWSFSVHKMLLLFYKPQAAVNDEAKIMSDIIQNNLACQGFRADGFLLTSNAEVFSVYIMNIFYIWNLVTIFFSCCNTATPFSTVFCGLKNLLSTWHTVNTQQCKFHFL